MKSKNTKKTGFDKFKNILDFWATNSEEGGWNISSTDEGSQKMLEDESDQQVKIQMGSDVVDDFIIDEDTSDDERMIVNMGPQHPSTHGVLRLQAELEGEVVRRVKPIIGYLHTGMEKTGEELNYFQGPTNTTRMDYLSPLFNELVFSLTTEKLTKIVQALTTNQQIVDSAIFFNKENDPERFPNTFDVFMKKVEKWMKNKEALAPRQ